MTKVLFLPFRNQEGQNPHTASSRIRCDWVAKYMDEATVAENEQELLPKLEEDGFSPYDIYVFQKRFHMAKDLELASKIKQAGKKIIFDLCDSEWAKPERAENLDLIMREANALTASTQFVADYMKKKTGKEVTVIPDRIDLAIHSLTKVHGDYDPLIVGWFGNKQTIEYLKDIQPDLEKVYKQKKFELHVIWENESHFKMGDIPTKSITWGLDTINNEISNCDVIVSPHRDDTLGKGKSNNKTVKSWALGIPCIEFNFEKELLLHLKNKNLRYANGMIGRRKVVEEYDVKQSVNQLRDIINKL